MQDSPHNKFRQAIQVLQRGRDLLVESLADDIVDKAEELVEGGFVFNELLETQGTRLHFLGLLLAQLEQSAEMLDEINTMPPPEPMPKPRKPRKPRSKKIPESAPNNEGPSDI